MVPEVAVAILSVAQLHPELGDLQLTQRSIISGLWERAIAEEGSRVKARIDADALRLWCVPVIHHYAQHAQRRMAASVYFEVAAKYAEKVHGTITQHQNVAGCTADGTRSLVVARYPNLPLRWDRICAGFREALLGDGGDHQQRARLPDGSHLMILDDASGSVVRIAGIEEV